MLAAVVEMPVGQVAAAMATGIGVVGGSVVGLGLLALCCVGAAACATYVCSSDKKPEPAASRPAP